MTHYLGWYVEGTLSATLELKKSIALLSSFWYYIKT